MEQGAWKAGARGWHVLDVPDGAVIAGFTVEGLLGAGACGAVYRVQRGGVPFALKLQPLAGLAGWAEREVAILLRLKHPNVVGFRACGTWPDHGPRWFYLAMELVEGRSLSQWLREESPCARRATLLLRGLARGLAAVHAADVLHRDIKESNVVVREAGGEPVLVDFGVGDYLGAPRLTQGVLPPGTPLYRSPESLAFQEAHWREPQARYSAAPADDLYALGVLAYLVLTSRYPDCGEGSSSAAHSPEVPAPHEVNARVPPALSALCLRLLSVTPGERGSALSLCAELEALLEGADAGWEVPLSGEAGGRAGPPLPAPRQEARSEETHSAPGEGPGGGRPGASARGSPPRLRWLAGAAVLVGMAVVLAGGLGTLPGGQHAVTDGREMARPVTRPEPAGAAAPPQAVSTSAAAALAAPQQESDMPVKTTPPVSDSPTPLSSGGLGPLGRALAMAATCSGLACSSGPQVRPRPPSEECPPGAVEAMKALGIDVEYGQRGSATFSPPDEDSGVVPVKEGPARIRVGLNLGELDNGTATGRLFISDRVYGYFDRATTKDGRSFPVCLALKQVGGGLGVPLESGDTSPGTARIESEVELKAVERFE